jgi:hypothetical protein
VEAVSVAEVRHHDRPAGHCAALASVGLSALLAMEVAFAQRQGPRVPVEVRSLIRRLSMENPQAIGSFAAIPLLGGFHHEYVRIA